MSLLGLTGGEAFDAITLSVLVALAGILVVGIRKAFKWFARRLFTALENLHRQVVREELTEQLQELKQNGGSSMKDQLNTIIEWLDNNRDKVGEVWLWMQEHMRHHEAGGYEKRSPDEAIHPVRASEDAGGPPRLWDGGGESGGIPW